jgi:hypothetical protein
MSHSFPPSPPDKRNEQHCCRQCGQRYEIWHPADPVESVDHVEVQVQCPTCGTGHTLNVPRGGEKDVRVEKLPGPEPETGAGD